MARPALLIGSFVSLLAPLHKPTRNALRSYALGRAKRIVRALPYCGSVGPSKASSSSIHSSSLSMRGLRILAFEDSYDIKRMMEMDGVKIEQFESFNQQWRTDYALEALKEFRPDVVLLDYYIPPITGLKVLRALNEAVANKEIDRPRYIIGMSSVASCNNEMLKEGADFAFVKHEMTSWNAWPR